MVIHTHYLLKKSYDHNKNDFYKRTQIKYLLISLFIYTFATSDFFVNYGFEFYPLGFLPILISLLIESYAILKHQLLDIDIVFKKSFIYTLSLACLSILYLGSVVILEKFLQNYLKYTSSVVSVSSAFIIGLVALPVRNKIQEIIDQHVLKSSHTEMIEQNELLFKEASDKEKFKSIAALASGIAHEIKNPLTSIKIFCEYLPEKKNDPEFMEKFNHITNKELNRINILIHQLLDFSKPSPLQLENTNIQNLIQETLHLLEGNISKKNIALNQQYDIHPSTSLLIDKNKLKQAFLNILLNAIDAMETSDTLTIHLQSVSIKGLKDQNQQIIINIKDTGIGIKSDDLKNIFTPFYSNKKHGTGLGLAITKRIIEEHKGKISVKSALNQGTSFMIYLSVLKS